MDSSLIGRAVSGLARLTALAGGAVLVAITVLIVVSVVGRALIWAGLGPVTGDYELVEAGVGFAIFAFLPWVHLTRGHAIVAIFTDPLGPRLNAIILAITDALMFAMAVFLTWRHALGTIDKFNYGETTLLLRMPLWWSYAAGLLGGVVFVIVAAYVLARSVGGMLSGDRPLPANGANH